MNVLHSEIDSQRLFRTLGFAGNFAKRVQDMAAETPADSGAQSGNQDTAPEESSLNALALLWGMIKDGVRKLFGRKPG